MITEHVWDIHFDSISNVVDVHINSLRNKIDKGFSLPLDPYGSRRRLPDFRQGPMKPLGITPKLTFLFAAVFTVMLGGLYIATYYLLANELETNLNQELLDRAAGLKGYLDFEDEQPVLMFDSNDAGRIPLCDRQPLATSRSTTSLTGALVHQSQELALLGLQFNPDEILAVQRRSHADGYPDRSGTTALLQRPCSEPLRARRSCFRWECRCNRSRSLWIDLSD